MKDKIWRRYELSKIIAREMKIISAVEGITISDLVESALIKYIAERKSLSNEAESFILEYEQLIERAVDESIKQEEKV